MDVALPISSGIKGPNLGGVFLSIRVHMRNFLVILILGFTGYVCMYTAYERNDSNLASAFEYLCFTDWI